MPAAVPEVRCKLLVRSLAIVRSVEPERTAAFRLRADPAEWRQLGRYADWQFVPKAVELFLGRLPSVRLWRRTS